MERNKVVTTETDILIKNEVSLDLRYFLAKGSKIPTLIDRQTQELIHDVDHETFDMCCLPHCEYVFKNSVERPLRLYLNKMTKLYEAEAAVYFNTGVYKDTGNVSLQVITKTFCFSVKNSKVFTKSKNIYTLYIDRSTNKPTFFCNGSLAYTNLNLNKAIYAFITLTNRFRTENPLADNFCKVFKDNFLVDRDGNFLSNESNTWNSPDKLRCLYRVKRSDHLFKDLPWKNDYISLIKFYQDNYYFNSRDSLAKRRERVFRHLRNNNTKKAVAAVFKNIIFPKSIVKELVKIEPLSLSDEFFDELKINLELFDINLIRTALNVCGRNYNCILRALNIGFSFKHLINSYKQNGYYLVNDTIHLHNRLDDGNLVFNSNLREYHDYLVNVNNTRNPRTIHGVNYTALYESVDTSKDIEPYVLNGYTLRSPVNTLELDTVGNNLNICVGIYKKRFFLKQTGLALIVDSEDSVIGCIEISLKHIIQAKLKHNNPVSQDKAIFTIVDSWVKANGYIVSTGDLNSEYSRRNIVDVSADKDRLELFNTYTEENKKSESTTSTIRGLSNAVIIYDDDTPFG